MTKYEQQGKDAIHLNTKDQLKNLLYQWECKEPIPNFGKMILIQFPYSQFKFVGIKKTKIKSTYGKCLYSVHFTNTLSNLYEDKK